MSPENDEWTHFCIPAFHQRALEDFLHLVFAFRQRALVERENDRWLEVGSMSAAATVANSSGWQ